LFSTKGCVRLILSWIVNA